MVEHVRGGESFSGQVREPVTEIVLTCCDKAAPITVKGMAYEKSGVAAVAVSREVWGDLGHIAGEGISPFLHTHFRSIYRGLLHRHPCPCLSHLSQLTCALDQIPH